MRIYIASSYRNLHAVRLLTVALTAQNHIVEDWTNLSPPLSADLTAEETKALLDSDDERGDIFDFCVQACTNVDLLIYLGPSGQDAACEVGLAASAGIPIFGLSGPFEKPGLILSRLVERWFSSVTDLLQAVNSGDGIPKCRVCGCTEFAPCDPACWWVEDDLCSNCAARLPVHKEADQQTDEEYGHAVP